MKVEHGVDAAGRRTVSFRVQRPKGGASGGPGQAMGVGMTWVASDSDEVAVVVLHPGLTARERTQVQRAVVDVAGGPAELARLEAEAEESRQAADEIIVVDLGVDLTQPFASPEARAAFAEDLKRRVDALRAVSNEPHALAWRQANYLHERLIAIAMWRIARVRAPDDRLPVDLAEVEIDEDVLDALQDAIGRALGGGSEADLGNGQSSPR